VEIIIDGLNLAYTDKKNFEAMSNSVLKCIGVARRLFGAKVSCLVIVHGARGDLSSLRQKYTQITNEIASLNQKKRGSGGFFSMFKTETVNYEELEKLKERANGLKELLEVYNSEWWEKFSSYLSKRLSERKLYIPDGIIPIPVMVNRKNNGNTKIEKEDDLAIASLIGLRLASGQPFVIFTNDRRLIEVPIKMAREMGFLSRKSAVGAVVRDASVMRYLRKSLGNGSRVKVTCLDYHVTQPL